MAAVKVTFRDGTPEARVKLGAFAQIAAKRHFGLEAMKTEDPEPVLFATFVELVGPAAAKNLDGFDAWLQRIDAFAVEEDDDTENPPPAESSSTSSASSPPTSA